MAEINPFNKFMVGAQGDKLRVMVPITTLTADDAILLAAYLVEMAEVIGPTHTFEDVREAVQNA